MRLAVTGADGFVGRAVVQALRDRGLADSLLLVDLAFEQPTGCATLELDLAEPGSAALIAGQVDCLIHLAALPGAAAQTDPPLSRAVNLDASLALMEAMVGKRFVYASSIAVLGSDLPDMVDDATPPAPVGTYGTHKRMVELAFADMVRRGDLSGMALRLPGIVARPAAAEGFGSSFLSEIFHAAREGRSYAIPVAATATSWLMSAETCARNLVHAALSKGSQPEAITLPAVRACMADMVSQLEQSGFGAGFSYEPNPGLQSAFGAYPPLHAARAEELGLCADGDLASLVQRVMAHG